MSCHLAVCCASVFLFLVVQYWTDRHQIFNFGRGTGEIDWPFICYAIAQGTLSWQRKTSMASKFVA